MTTAIEFGSYDHAQTFRERHSEHIAASDDGRFKTVVLAEDAPADVLAEAEQAASAGEGEGVTDGDPETFEEQEDRLDPTDLGDLRRSWGEYIAGVRQAFRAFHHINDLRGDVSLDLLGFADIEGTPEDVTAGLLDELRVRDDVVPEDMTPEEMVEAAHHAETPGTLPEPPASDGDSVLEPATAKAVEADISISPDEMFHGTGAVGMGASELDRALRAEEGQDISLSDIADPDALDGDTDRHDPPGDLDPADLDGIGGWSFDGGDGDAYEYEHEQDATESTTDALDAYAVLRLRKTADADSRVNDRITDEWTVEYREKEVWEENERENKRIKLCACDGLQAALEEAWQFVHLPPSERLGGKRFGYPTETRDRRDGGTIEVPTEVGDWSLVPEGDTDEHRIAWEAVTVGSEEAPNGTRKRVQMFDRGDHWNIGLWRYTPHGTQVEAMDTDWSKTNKLPTERALSKVVHHMEHNDSDHLDDVKLPEFDLTCKPRALKPVLDAVKRFAWGDEGSYGTHVVVEQEGIEFRSSNTAQSGMTVARLDASDIGGPGSSGHYRVQHRGEAVIDATTLWRYLTDANLTAHFSMTVRQHDENAPPKAEIKVDGEQPEVFDGYRNRQHVWFMPKNDAVTYTRGEDSIPENLDYPLKFSAEASDLKQTVREAWQTSKEEWQKQGAVYVVSDDVGQYALYEHKSGEAFPFAESKRLTHAGDYGHDTMGVLYSSELLRDVTLPIPRPSGKYVEIEYGGAERDGETPERIANGVMHLRYEVGDEESVGKRSYVEHLIAPRVAGEKMDSNSPLRTYNE